MESCTAGLISNSICDFSHASEILKGSLITYLNEVKIMFGVDKKYS